MTTTTLVLPYPPSVNHYWRLGNGHLHISDEGLAYSQDVKLKCAGIHGLGEERLAVYVDIHQPDRRRRDIDNVAKALLDALRRAEVYADDSQIDTLVLRRLTNDPPHGHVEVLLEVL